MEGDMVFGDEEDEEDVRNEEFLIEDLARKFMPFKKLLWPVDPSTGWPNVPFMIAPSGEWVFNT